MVTFKVCTMRFHVLIVVVICVKAIVSENFDDDCPTKEDALTIFNECKDEVKGKNPSCIPKCMVTRTGLTKNNGQIDIPKIESIVNECREEIAQHGVNIEELIKCYRNQGKVYPSDPDCKGYDDYMKCSLDSVKN